MNTDIKHTGTVFDIAGKRIDVAVEAESACATCKVKGVCGMSESQQKLVSVFVERPEAFSIGEKVMVSVSKGMGMKAVVFAYVIPFFILFISLLVFSYSGLSELSAGLLSMGLTAGYYFFLYLYRGRLEREIIFKIQKI